VPAGLCCREVGPRLGPQGALERRASTIKRHYRPKGLLDMSATARYGDPALRTRDVDRSSRSLAASRPFTFQPELEERNDQRA
jgi:hypothetical protein